jgi:thiol-disulfide isomerase/thioredoxin/stalled ribosome alternative rescue factor ArfA
MKNIILLLAASFVFSSCSEKNYVLFSGNITNTKDTTMKIGNISRDFQKEVSIDENGNFRDTLFINSPGAYSYQIGRSYAAVFFREGYDLNLNLDANDFFKSRKFKGNGSEVNNYHVARSALKNKLVGDAKAFFVVPIEDFMTKIGKNKDTFLDFLEASTLKGQDKEIQRKIIEHDYLLTRYNYDKFNHYHTKIHPELPEGYYAPIIEMDLDDEVSFIYDRSYRNLIVENWRLTSKEAMEIDPSLTQVSFVKNKIKNIKSTKIKDLMISMLFRQISLKNKKYKTDYPRILEMLTADQLKEKLTAKFVGIQNTKPEMPAPNFNYENHKGGTTSLKDLKGKILYVEVWATWCGPCIKEMPALTQLIKDFKGQDIEFISISIDSENDYEKWRKMVPEKNVGGIQLLADKGLKSDFMQAFSIGLIPRSILLDKKGKIITHKAPRPSATNTKSYLDNLLSGSEKAKKSFNFK